MTPEGWIKAKFSKGLKAIQARHPGKLMVRMPVLRGMGLPLLDYLLCANGQFILVEAKRDQQHEPTAQQKTTIREAKAAGAIVLLVYNDATIEAALNHITEWVSPHGRAWYTCSCGQWVNDVLAPCSVCRKDQLK